MITQNQLKNQLPNETFQSFKELNVLYHLRKVGITKIKGFSTSFIFFFLFSLIFNSMLHKM